MSRSSPGRYALHEFAKNVFDVRITDEAGKALAVTRPNPHEWDVTGHAGTVRVTYKVFGDRLDGTYLAVDASHAHINMPAAIMWARGFERRPVTIRFERPTGTSWRVATQLSPGTDPLSFTAPNLQYLMDSPSEFGTFTLRSFTAPDDRRTPVFRLAVHHTGTDAEVDGLARDVEAIVREARHVFGEYPPFEGNTYTFIADYLPWAHGDGMEHRNSTILTSPSSIQADRLDLLDTIAHEFFHTWNVERIRPKSLEPFNFEEANMSGELWLAEGFTSYYGPLTLKRAGPDEPARRSCRDMDEAIEKITHEPCPPDAIGGRDEPSGAVRRCRDVDRPDELREHLHLLLHVGRGDRRSASISRCAIARTEGDAGRFHARALESLRPSRHQRAGIRRDAVHD